MPESTKSYRGRQLIVDADAETPKLEIDGRPIQVRRDSTGKFWSVSQPFAVFDTLEALGQSIISTRPHLSREK
jgi:hypothetical protein